LGIERGGIADFLECDDVEGEGLQRGGECVELLVQLVLGPSVLPAGRRFCTFQVVTVSTRALP
jgi:hypothetical protein